LKKKRAIKQSSFGQSGHHSVAGRLPMLEFGDFGLIFLTLAGVRAS
jgi:hypothetical protein